MDMSDLDYCDLDNWHQLYYGFLDIFMINCSDCDLDLFGEMEFMTWLASDLASITDSKDLPKWFLEMREPLQMEFNNIDFSKHWRGQ